jgi:hypothetical protein
MVFTKPFLYLSVLNFTGWTSHPNRLFRVSKSRNGDPQQREAKETVAKPFVMRRLYHDSEGT